MKKTRHTLTLIESLIIVLIAAILAAIALPQHQKAIADFKCPIWLDHSSKPGRKACTSHTKLAEALCKELL